MNAEQYRALVAKLEAIQNIDNQVVNEKVTLNPDGSIPPTETVTLPNGGTIVQRAKDPAASEPMTSEPAASAPAAAPAPAPAADPNQIPTIEAATFSQAYAKAKKQGLKKFKWCGIYAVKDKVNPQPVVTKPEPGKVDWIGQSDPLGGDKQNPMSFAPNSGFGA